MASKYIIEGPVTIKDVNRDSLGQQCYNSILRNQNLPTACVDVMSEERISYKTMLEKTCHLADSLRKFGIGQDDVVGIFSENSVYYYYPLIATLYVGGVVTVFNPNYSSGEILHTANISKPTVMFCSIMYVDTITEMKPLLRSVKKIVVLDVEDENCEWESLENFITKSKNVNLFNFKITQVEVDEKTAFIMYSSGTTGLPKGVMLTHMNINVCTHNVTDPKYILAHEAQEVTMLGLLPFFHVYGIYSYLTALFQGHQVAILQAFDPELFLKTIQDYKITTLPIVPSLANFLSKSPFIDKYDLSSVEVILCGAAPLSTETINLLLKRMKGSTLYELYGMTETLGPILSAHGDIRLGSIGKIVPNMSAKVIDLKSGSILGPRQPGELCFKGGMVMKGYAGNSKATESIIDQDGWLHSGDVGYFDEDGFFFIVDRVKELIKYNGFQVPPSELEAILLQHPLIMDAGVVGQPDERAGELPVALVVTDADNSLTEDEVINFVTKQISPQKRLHRVKFVSEIPKTPSGKILRKALREMLIQHPKGKL